MKTLCTCKSWFRIQLGKQMLHVFLLDNGEYCLDAIEVTSLVDLEVDTLADFLNMDEESLSSLGLEAKAFFIPKQLHIEGLARPIQPILLDTALLYWHQCVVNQMYSAQVLILSLLRRLVLQSIKGQQNKKQVVPKKEPTPQK
jgi:hypothetical protein